MNPSSSLSAAAQLWAQYGPSMLDGLATTLEIAAVAIVGSLAGGIVVAFARMSSLAPVRALAAAYVDFVRCVPLLVHAMFWYFGATELLPDAAKEWLYDRDASMIAGSVALIVYSAAFVSEDLRSGIRSIPRGQVEAARALGFSALATFRLVVLPQAVRAVIPPLIGQAMTITKNTSITLMIGVVELISAARRVQDTTFRIVEPYAFATLSYLLICSVLTLIAMRYERGAREGGMLDIAREYWLQILIGNFPNGPLGGVALTLVIAVAGLLLALPAGIVLALGLTSTSRTLARATTGFVFYMRSVPLLMHLLWIHYLVLPLVVGHALSGLSSVLVTLVIFNGAYLSQTIKAGMLALPRGQYEAARSMGFGHLGAIRRVIGPQALRNVTPSIVGQLVTLIKETSLGSLIGLAETTQQFLDLNDRLGNRSLEVFALLAMTFFVLCYPLTLFGRWLERRYARGPKLAAAPRPVPVLPTLRKEEA